MSKKLPARNPSNSASAPQAQGRVGPTSQAAEDWLGGGGEMGKLIRSMDWSKTALGPMEAWPQSLRTTVSLALASDFPINLVWGPEHVQIYNDGFWPMCGAMHPTSMGQNFSESWASAWDAIGEHFERALAGQTSYLENQRMFVDRNGYLEETFFTFSFSPIRDESGGIGGTFQPVTETTATMLGERRTRALRDLAARTGTAPSVEEALHLAAESLAESELDLPFVLFYLIDSKAESARLVAWTGLVPDSPASPLLTALDATHWPLREVVATRQATEVGDLASRFPVLAAGVYPEPVKAAFLLPITPSGAERPLAVAVAGVSQRLPLNEAYRTFYDLLAAGLTSAVANARAYEVERQRAEALAAIDRAKSLFFSNVSHEFRTPLTLMLGPLEDALASGLIPTAQRDLLELAHRNSLRLLKLVNSLLDFSRIEAGRIVASYEEIDLPRATAELASLFRAAIERAGLTLAVRCEPLATPAYVDREMWEKIVLNLLSNALKFTLHGGIEVDLREEAGQAVLLVTDTGTGISEGELPRVFERFHRVQGARARSHEGSGIGLALLHELVKLHGGQVSVESTVGKGSTFRVDIPLGQTHLPTERIGAARSLQSTALGAAPFVEEAQRWIAGDLSGGSPAVAEAVQRRADRATAVDNTAPAVDVPARLRSARVLVADDNADLREYVARLLQPYFTVEAVANGEEALEAARARKPDLILTDVMMPVLDGFELLREVRSDRALRGTPVILLSARAGEESRVEGLQLGADDYLVKPFAARELVARVRANLEMAEVREEIARHVTTERILRESEEKYRALFENSAQGYVIGEPLFDAIGNVHDLRYLLINPAFEVQTGLRIANLLGKRMREAVPGIESHWFEHFDRVAKSGRPVRIESFNQDTGRWYEVVIFPHPKGLLAYSFVDVTARKQDEARLAADLDALTRMHALSGRQTGATSLEQLLQETVETAVAIVRANQGTLQLLEGGTLRITAHHGHGRPFLEFFSAVENVDLVCGEAIRRGQRVLVDDVEESPLFAGTPSLPVFRAAGVRAVQSTPMRSSGGRLLGVLSTHWSAPFTPDEHDLWRLDLLARQAADLLEQKQAEDALREADRRKDAFIATLSHELRNPLAAIRGAGQLLASQRTAAHERGVAAEIVNRQADMMNRLLDDLLDTSRINLGLLVIEKQSVSVASVIDAALEATQSVVDAAKHTVSVSITPRSLVVDADPMRIAQVIANLVTNAAKYTDPGGEISIEALVSTESDHVIIAITDNGTGLSREDLTRLFDMFSQGENARERAKGGVGIGLALAKGVLELHGGWVRAESAGVGTGSRFVIGLPRLADRIAIPRLVENRAPGSAPEQNKLRIVLADDNKDMLAGLGILLNHRGHEVFPVASGHAAIAEAERVRPDVAVLDIGMPDLDGYEVARRIRATEWGAKLRLVALTGWGRAEDVQLARDVGFDAHVTKGTEPSKLYEMIETWTAHPKP